ncbi:ammonium transporter [Aquibium sp. ELW1220]|uniref:ammonium transporter n=1 Tax=Aquibium sp. ELW1220 TaxID=2976766 RepID=UPI0025AF9E77|nr:ammonium transporter [Aquibium sp. ELW1220]MDN2583519.1 ammonium transporter [Aquibium sp. ELW1220]
MTHGVRSCATAFGAACGVIAATALPALAQGAAEPTLAGLQKSLDMAWMLLAAALVLMMQFGFLLLEAGMVRSKNTINVAQKNVLDLAVSITAFLGLGFMLAFAPGNGLPWGSDASFLFLSGLDSWQVAFFAFHVMFCGTAATIVSGAVAERMRLSSYLISSAVLAGLVYPVFVHWAWGAALAPSSSAFLANAGFVDFAGSTVVHATGGWVALAACLVLGARIGRFDAEGRPVRIAGHNPVMAASGTLVLFVGWIGFNGGSTLSATPAIAGVIANTIVAGGAGGVAGYLLGWRQDGVVLPEKTMSGTLGGLVAVTAGCMVLEPLGALAVGLTGGIAAILGNQFLERRCGVDDAVGAIGVHAFAGVAGTLALALLAPEANLPLGNRFAQFQVQAIGVAVNFAWTFGTALAFFWMLDRLQGIRVSRHAEIVGLNEAEHATRMGIGHVEKALGRLVSGNADLNMRLAPNPGDDAETLTRLFNELMDRIQAEEENRATAKWAARDLEEAERLSALAEATFEAIWIVRDGLIVDGNVRLRDLFGEPVETLRGRPALKLFPVEQREAARVALAGESGEPFETEIVGAGGVRVPVEIRGRTITYRGAASQIVCLVDLRERKDAEERIRHLALHDPLTGLPNRALFNERLAAMVAAADAIRSQSALLLVDLDRFKDINDVYGHPAGDLVIRTAAERIRALGEPGVTVARLGGDEFAVLLPAIDFANQAADFAYRLVAQLIRPIALQDGRVVRVGASVGVVICPRDGHEPALLISRADIALYQAKKSGRNTYCVFEPGMDDFLTRRRLLEADLALAISRAEFELHFQPRVNITEDRIVSYEALLRWRHPRRGSVEPSDFIPIAEQSGKIVEIGEWVLRAACVAARDDLAGARVSVNVSPVQFRQKTFVEMVETVLRETRVDPALIEIEITEGVLIDDDRRAHAILKALKALGLAIAMDDFGTGYSSLSYLGRFPFDTIKIDRSFVRELGTSENARAIVQSIIGLGHGLKMNLIAEGVETLEEAGMLAAMGCQELQGFLLGRPAPLGDAGHPSQSEIADILRRARALNPQTTGPDAAGQLHLAARTLREAAVAAGQRRAG